MPDPPYPGPQHAPQELTITYTLRDVLDQMNTKLDVLPGLVTQTQAQESRLTKVEADVVLVKEAYMSQSSITNFKDKTMAKLIGLVTLFGGIVGIMIAIVRTFLPI